MPLEVRQALKIFDLLEFPFFASLSFILFATALPSQYQVTGISLETLI
jgi:hypothetical protein